MVTGTLRIRPAGGADLDAINRIYNHEVLTGVATWDEEPWTTAARLGWFEALDPDTEPVFVAEQGGAVIGFAYLSRYRLRTGYRFTREDTLYVDPVHQRRGIGRALLTTLIGAAEAGGMHTLVARIEAGNRASIELHERLGFIIAGRTREVGFKFGRWLDLVEMQRLL